MPFWFMYIFQPQSKMKTIRKKYNYPYNSTKSIHRIENLVLIFGLILISLNCTLCNSIPCQLNNWWDSMNNECIPCTECNKEKLIVLRPCQLHQDTICGSIQDLELDYRLLTKTDTNWKEKLKDGVENVTNPDSQDNLTNLELENKQLESWWDMFLITVIVLLLLFFVFIAYLSYQHMRRWRQIERRLDRDVEELSAKLMAKLANVQNIENGNFLIENPIRDANIRPVQVHCVLLDHYLEKNNVGLPNTGNLYIERTNQK